MKSSKVHHHNKVPIDIIPRSIGIFIPVFVATIGWFLQQYLLSLTGSSSWLVSAGLFDSARSSSTTPTTPFKERPWRRKWKGTAADDVWKETEVAKEGETTSASRTNVVKLERGKYISNKITAEELYEAYLDIKKDYEEKAFCHANQMNCKKGWKVLKQTDDGVEIAMLSHPSDPSCPYVRMSAIMPGTVQDVWDFLALENWEETMPHMDPFYEGLDIFGTYRYKPHPSRLPMSINPLQHHVEMVLARKRTKRLLTFGKRDFTFLSVSDVPHSNVWVSGTVSIITPKLFPRQKGYTRAFQDSIAFYEPHNADNNDDDNQQEQTALTIVCRIDLNDSAENGQGGGIPMWIYVKTIGNTGVLSIQNMRQQLLKRKLDHKTYHKKCLNPFQKLIQKRRKQREH